MISSVDVDEEVAGRAAFKYVDEQTDESETADGRNGN